MVFPGNGVPFLSELIFSQCVMFRKVSFFSHWCFWIVLIISLVLNAVLLTKGFWCSPTWSEYTIVFQTSTGEKPITQDAFLGKVADFYQTLVNYQFAMITVVLGVSFVYSYLISTRQTREIIDDELYSEHFREHYLPKAKELAQEMMIDTFNNNDLINGIGDLSSRLEEVERALDRLEANPKPTNTRLVKKATKKAVKKKATK